MTSSKKRVSTPTPRDIRKIRLEPRVTSLEGWQRAVVEQEGAKSRVIMDMSFSTNSIARLLTSAKTILAVDIDKLAAMDRSKPIMPADLEDLLRLVPVTTPDVLSAEREHALREFLTSGARREPASPPDASDPSSG